MPTPRPVMLVILDGFGWREETADNAVALAHTPNFDRLWQAGPKAFLHTSGDDVGLPDGQMGNSEVGHINIGAGRVVPQELARIGRAIADGSLASAPALQTLIHTAQRTGGTCHLMGLVSDGGVHGHQDHAVALAQIIADAGINIAVHIFTDGRDTGPQTAATLIPAFVKALPKSAAVATISGRYYTMDRDQRWDRIALAYNAISAAAGPHFPNADSVIQAAYTESITDEFIHPAIIGDYRGIKDGDVLLCFNFRADRIRELLAPLLDPDFDGFPRPQHKKLAYAAGMTQYSEHLATTMGALFAPITLKNILGEIVANAGRTQLRMAETEKYPHVTYFLNGGEETPYAGEDRIMVPSPKIATYDLQPEMSAPELAEKAVAAINTGKYDLIVLNFANPDMVGHTGSLAAAITAVETVDAGLGRIADAVVAQGGALLVTADHGNCEMMRDPETGGPHTAHTTNPVPVFLTGKPGAHLHDGRLADLAPTLLDLMDLEKPKEMTGTSLL
jgi:2,3-bisphosphoglycerate-independent phosphoglycerate mutase